MEVFDGLENLDGAAETVAAKVAELHLTEGEVLEQAVRWKPARWQGDVLAQLAPYLDAVVDLTDDGREEERLIRRRHVATFEDPAARFLASMIWGFGVRGYGPSRVGAIARNAGDRLNPALEVITDAAHTGAAEAWNAFTGAQKLKGLGPAFATKVAYFAALAVDDAASGPLIADLNTSWAMWDLVRLPRSVQRRDTYLTYVVLARRWANEMGCRPDDVEWALFEIGKNSSRTVT